MLNSFYKKISNWTAKRGQVGYKKIVVASHHYRADLLKLTDGEFKAEVATFRANMAKLPELTAPNISYGLALAVEAARRSIGKTPYQTQELAAVGLYHGALIEMGTGEGKTLVAPLAAFLASLSGQQVHVVTANDYLAQRDAAAMHPLYQLLDMSVGFLVSGPVDIPAKQNVYRCDVVYGAHSIFPSDYLHDRLVLSPEALLQTKPLGFAIVDEADAVLLDEARTPIVISASIASDSSMYSTAALIANSLIKGDAEGENDFWVDQKDRVALFTDAGYENINQALLSEGLLNKDSVNYDAQHQQVLTRIQHALAAKFILHKDHHYTVLDGDLILIDELTGRLLPGSKWDSGLQQAIEFKEGLALSPAAMPRATITRQKYFKLYAKLAGMTGTAAQDAEEFQHTYGLSVMVVPPFKTCIRKDHPARIFRTQQAKQAEVIKEVETRHKKGQPILIGTATVEQSEALAKQLTDKGFIVAVLNAKNNEKEAEILASAGKFGAITVTTSMAGRGVDIPLGGHVGLELQQYLQQQNIRWEELSSPDKLHAKTTVEQAIAVNAGKVKAVGGLFVLGLERYETRRLDRQLQGRAGRQGDPGETSFFISLEDPMVENFAGEYMRSMLSVMDISEGSELESKVVAKAVEGAQRQVEGRSFGARKNLLQYDSILHDQRTVFYEQRQDILVGANSLATFKAILHSQIKNAIELAGTYDLPETWDFFVVSKRLAELQVPCPDENNFLAMDSLSEVIAAFLNAADVQVEQVFSQIPVDEKEKLQEHLAKMALLYGLDLAWAHHLEELALVRQGIYLRAHAKVSPIEAYKKEAYTLFESMLDRAQVSAITALLSWKPNNSAV